MPQRVIAIAFPVAPAQRELQRKVAEPIPMPALYRDGAEERPCTACGMRLNVGPRILASGAPIYCVICATWEMEHEDGPVETISLHNPDSHPEPLTDADVDAFLARIGKDDDPERLARIRAKFEARRKEVH